MDIMTRTDLSLDKPAAKGILEYQETAFAQKVKKILNPES